MMTVRFPSGFSIQYNDANYAVNNQWGYADLYTKQGGKLIAQAPHVAVIEWVQPCRTYNAADEPVYQRSIELLAKEIRSLKRKLAASTDSKDASSQGGR